MRRATIKDLWHYADHTEAAPHVRARGPRYRTDENGEVVRTRRGKLIEVEPGRGRRFYVEFKSPWTGRSWSRTFDRREDAVAHQERLNSPGFRYDEQAELAGENDSDTFSAVAAEFIAARSPRWRPLTLDQHRRHLRLRILPALGARPVDSITTADIDRLVASWAVSGTTRSGAFDLLRSIFRYAVESQYIDRSPVDRRSRPARDTPAYERVLTNIEQAELVAAAPEWARPLLLLACATGMRRGELAGLSVADLRTAGAAPTIRVRQQLVGYTAKRGPVLGPTKSDPRGRIVPISRDVATALAEIARDRPRSELLFVDPTGRPLSPQRMQRLMQATLSASGLAVPPRSSWHLLRHSRISLWLEAGVAITTIAGVTGHDPAMLARTYAHPTQVQLDRMRTATLGLVPVPSEDEF